MPSSPRVTLGVATSARDTSLAEAVQCCLQQTYADLEVLVVAPTVEGRPDDPRVRVVALPPGADERAALDTVFAHARGELVAVLSPQDRLAGDAVARQVTVFDAHPETAMVHGDATLVDGAGVQRGRHQGYDLGPGELLRRLVRTADPVAPATRLMSRRALEAAGGGGPSDLDLHLRLAASGRIRHVGGAPLATIPAAARHIAADAVEAALCAAVDRTTLRDLVPELDWPVLHSAAAERRALELLADAVDRRDPAAPRLAVTLRERATRLADPPAPRRDRGKLLMTAFGWNDSGGGTTIPRLAAKELVRRGWDVTVFHAAVKPDPSGVPYAVREWEEDGVRLVGVHNRDHGLWDLGNPLRELDDPPITEAFAQTIDRVAPDVVHFHNLHNLGAQLIDVAAARGVPSFFTTHNYWLVCPRAYLLRGDGSLCNGPAGGVNCAECVGSHDVDAHRARFEGIRDRFTRGITTCMAVSHAVRRTLVAQGYPAEMIDVVQQCVPAQDETWQRVGRDRTPGRVAADGVLTVGFFGSAYPHKGPQLLVEAAQRTTQPVRIRIHGELPPQMREHLTALDRRGVVELHGAFSPAELPDLLTGVDAAALPSIWWDCAPLAAGECLAARVPVIAPRMGGLNECITDGVDGLAFDGGDVDGLAAQLDRLAGEPGLLERLQEGIGAPRGFATWIDELEAYYGGARPCPVTEEPPLAVRWTGEQATPTSLARINREVVDRLDADPGLVAQRWATDAGTAPAPLPRVADVEVRHQWPPDFTPPASGHLALVQPWEFGSIPEDWVQPLQAVVDELWVPSQFVRRMYLDAGLEADRVKVVPNGVDLDRFRPDGPTLDALGSAEGRTRFLFVGGVIPRKGIDVLLSAWVRAFAGRDDVELVVKDYGADGIYRRGDRSEVARLAEDRNGPPVVHLTESLTDAEIEALYRSCDVLVHPYRGEGFAMPVLEAMASGLPVIVTAGGPTDEFCPADAGWRLRSSRREFASRELGRFTLVAPAWELEPDVEHLVELLQTALDAGPQERARRGALGRDAAAQLSWEAVGGRYAQHVRDLVSRPARGARTSATLTVDEVAPRLLAAPAWRGDPSGLRRLLVAWSKAAPAGTIASLTLLADPALTPPDAVEAAILAAVEAVGVDLEACADIAVRLETPWPGRDAGLHVACDGFVALSGADAGHARLARDAGRPVLAPDPDQLSTWLADAGTPTPTPIPMP